MKKTINLFFCLVLILSGCKDNEEPYAELSVTMLDFMKTAGEQTVDIYTNVAWEANVSPESAASWLSVSPSSGTGQNSTVTVSVMPNDGYDNRTASVIFQSAAGVQTLQVTQWKTDTVELVGDKEYVIGQPGGGMPITIRKNTEYTVEISDEAKSWIHQVTTRGLSSEVLKFNIDENTTKVQRQGEIYVRGKVSGSDLFVPELADTVKIIQEELSLSTDYEKLQFGPYAEKKWIIVTSTHRYLPDKADNSFAVSDYTYSLQDGAADWCTVEKNSGNADYLSVSVKANTTGKSRAADITVTSSALSCTVRVEQQADMGGDYYNDGDWETLQSKSKGNGVNIIVMGDGFTKTDMEKDGLYETAMRRAAECFFSVEPFKSYREYFNVYMIAVESEEGGVNDSATKYAPQINNKLGSAIGESTSTTWDLDLCTQYIKKDFPQFKYAVDEEDGLYVDDELLVILVLNTHRYAGTTFMYESGYCVAGCAMFTEEEAPFGFEGVVHHEAGGHGFGLFQDEYVLYPNATIPLADKQRIEEAWQKQPGFYQNVDFTGNTARIRWKDFIGNKKYPYVGAYEGACIYQYGVWRSEQNSCMNDNVPYYSAQCRYVITKRIMRLAGEAEPTFAEFVAHDNVTPPAKTRSRVPYREMPPLGRPRMIKVN